MLNTKKVRQNLTITPEFINELPMDKMFEVSKLRASDTSSHDKFGASTSMSEDGLNLIVGAPYKSINGLVNNGQVYTYTRSNTNDTWTEVSKITASDAVGFDAFGYSVSISNNGLNLVVGAAREDASGTHLKGRIYTYTRASINDEWIEVSKLIASDAADNDYFGHSISISGNGLSLVVGAFNKSTDKLHNNGQVYTYTRNTVNDDWIEISKLVASDTTSYSYFGYYVSISNDGLDLIIGACCKSINELVNNGQMYTYVRDTTNDTWSEASKSTASDGINYDRFGLSLSMANNGKTLVLGAPYKDIGELKSNGQVYTYTYNH